MEKDKKLHIVTSTTGSSMPKAEIDYYRQGKGYVIYEMEPGTCQHKQHTDCMAAKVWDWPAYQGGACPSCEETFRTRYENHVKDLKENLAGYMAHVGIGKRHHGCTIEGFSGSESAKKICLEIIKNPGDLLLTGPPGTGKTHLAAAIVRELILSGKIFLAGETNLSRAMFKTVPDLLLDIRKTYSRANEDTEDDVVDLLKHVPLLILDDLGAEKPSEWAVTMLYGIVDARYRALKPTVVTSNLSLSQIATQLHDRIASRLSQGKIIKLTGSDYRARRENMEGNNEL